MNPVLQDNAVYAKEVEKMSSGELLVQAPVWTVGSARAPSELTEVPFSEVLNPPQNAGPGPWMSLPLVPMTPNGKMWSRKRSRETSLFTVYIK